MRRISKALVGAVSAAALALSLTTALPAQAAEVTADIVDHGQIPLTATTIAGAASGNMPDGSPRLWAVVNGKASEGVPTYLAEDRTVWVAGYMAATVYYLPSAPTRW